MTTIPIQNIQTILPPPPENQRRPFLTPIPELPGEFLMVVDNTSLEKVKRCHKAGQNYLVLGREPHARNAALTFGGAIHEALDKFHHAEWWNMSGAYGLETDEKYGASAQDAAIVKYFTENPAPSEFPDYRTVNCALEVMSHYRRRSNPLLHPDYEWEIQSDDKGPIIERAFEIPLAVLDFADLWVDCEPEPFKEGCIFRHDDNNNFQYEVQRIHLAWSGRIDLIAKANSHIRIVDHKTSSIDGDQFIQSFQLSSQTIGYVWAARQLFPDLDVTGFCLNCIRLKKPTGSVGLMERGPRGGEPALSFFRNYFDYSEDLISRWQRDTILLIEDFLHSLSRSVFPMNDRHCFDKFGRCPYFDACTIDSEAVGLNYLMSDAFKQVSWNPTAGRTLPMSGLKEETYT